MFLSLQLVGSRDPGISTSCREPSVTHFTEALPWVGHIASISKNVTFIEDRFTMYFSNDRNATGWNRTDIHMRSRCKCYYSIELRTTC